MRTKHHAHLTLFCLTDTECADIPAELDFKNILKDILNKFFTLPPDVTMPPPGITPPENFTIPDYLTTPFPIPELPESFVQADYTHTMMLYYVGFNAAWAVTCFIAIGKWKE